ncbi:hypothetical protein [Dactylosporangium sp. CA-092794]|uniref:hypothetical protein n=1 Tax=Dactylosporangium sp. CA-092794 TaxID=3239929 RepID=UPI003D91C335
MTDIRYDPTFQHTDWVDNVDRIVAGGPKGFNVRLHAIESDLQQLSTVVAQIDKALDQIRNGTVPVGTGDQQLVLPVTLVSLPGFSGGNGIFYDVNGEAHPRGGSGGGAGVMGVDLPQGARVTSFRAVGRFGGPHDFSVTLGRASLVDVTKASDTLAVVAQNTPGFTNPYDLTVPVNAAFATVNQNAFRYFVFYLSTFVGDPNGTSVSTVQINYTLS